MKSAPKARAKRTCSPSSRYRRSSRPTRASNRSPCARRLRASPATSASWPSATHAEIDRKAVEGPRLCRLESSSRPKRENGVMRRSNQRRDAVFACYQRDVTGRPLEELVAESRPFTRELAAGVEAHRDELDAAIAAHAKGWELERIAPLERNLMRVALYEMEHSEDVPTEVAIDEAIEIAKEYCGADAPGFVNGVLGAIVREREGVR